MTPERTAAAEALTSQPPPGRPPARGRQQGGGDHFETLLDQHQARTADAEGQVKESGQDSTKSRSQVAGRRSQGDAHKSQGDSDKTKDDSQTAQSADNGAAVQPTVAVPAVAPQAPVIAAVPAAPLVATQPADAVSISQVAGTVVQAAAGSQLPGAVASPVQVTPPVQLAATSTAPVVTGPAPAAQPAAPVVQAPQAPAAPKAGTDLPQPTAAQDPTKADPTKVDPAQPEAATPDSQLLTPDSPQAPQAPARYAPTPAPNPNTPQQDSQQQPQQQDPKAPAPAPAPAPAAHQPQDTPPTPGIPTPGAQTAPQASPLTQVAQPTTAAAPAPTPDGPPPGARLAQAVETVQQVIRISQSNGITQARVQLHPEELGSIDIHLRATADGVVARVVTNASQAAAVLRDGGDELRRQLASQGINLSHFDVGTSSQEQAQSGFLAGDGESRRRGGSTGSNASEPDLPATPTPETTISLPNGVLVDVLA